MAKVRSNSVVDINFDFDEISENIKKYTQKELLKQQKINVREIKRATASWSKPVELNIDESDESATIEIEDDRYRWVDEGTKPHEIKPKNARALRFLPGNRVRAEIARRKQNAAQRDVNTVFSKAVNNPGIRPRSITEKILAKRRKAIFSAIEDAVEKAIKK